MSFEPPETEKIKAIFPQFQEVYFLNKGGFKAVYKIVVNGICQCKLDTLLNNLDSKCRVDICFG